MHTTHTCTCTHTCARINKHIHTLTAEFERYDALRAEVMLDKITQRPRGFGFVFFKDEGGLKDAIRDMHEKVYMCDVYMCACVCVCVCVCMSVFPLGSCSSVGTGPGWARAFI
jgi:hypothetical protein